MEQIQELLEILKQTPEMVIWALSLYFLFILLKLASWVFALKVVDQQSIKRYFDYRDKSLSSKKGAEIAKHFRKDSFRSVGYGSLIELLNAVKGGRDYIDVGEINVAIQKIRKKD